MKKGDVVMVYQDPITELKPEGKVELLKFISSDGEVECWRVRFLDYEDEMVVQRSIKAKPTVAEDALDRIDLVASLAERFKRELKCDRCGALYRDPKDLAYAEKMRTAWAASQRAEGREPRGGLPVP